MFTPLQKILPASMRSYGITRQVEAALICEKFRRLAPRVIHEQALEHIYPKSFRNSVLAIGTLSSAWAAEVKKHEKEILETINRSLGIARVKQVKTWLTDHIPSGIPNE